MLKNNENWQTWILGIAAALFTTLVVSSLMFRSEVKQTLGEFGVTIKYLIQRVERLEQK